MGGWARDTLWRQGHVLPDGAAATLRLCTAETAAACLAIVISHDCDLANDPDQEPFVEVIVGCRVAKADGSCTHAKNARKLHVAFRQGQASIVGEFFATAKRRV